MPTGTIDRSELIDRSKALLAEAYDEVAWMVMLWLDDHPRSALKPLCREIDSENPEGLAKRIERRRAARNRDADAESARRAAEGQARKERAAKQLVRDDSEGFVEALSEEEFDQLYDAAVAEHHRREPSKRSDPTEYPWRPEKPMTKAVLACSQAWRIMQDELPQDDASREQGLRLSQKLGRYSEAFEDVIEGRDASFTEDELNEFMEGVR